MALGTWAGGAVSLARVDDGKLVPVPVPGLGVVSGWAGAAVACGELAAG